MQMPTIHHSYLSFRRDSHTWGEGGWEGIENNEAEASVGFGGVVVRGRAQVGRKEKLNREEEETGRPLRALLLSDRRCRSRRR